MRRRGGALKANAVKDFFGGETSDARKRRDTALTVFGQAALFRFGVELRKHCFSEDSEAVAHPLKSHPKNPSRRCPQGTACSSNYDHEPRRRSKTSLSGLVSVALFRAEAAEGSLD